MNIFINILLSILSSETVKILAKRATTALTGKVISRRIGI